MRARHIAARGAGVLALAVVLVAMPTAMWRAVGWPLPRQRPAWSQVIDAVTISRVTDTQLLDVLAVVWWLLWGVFAACVVLEVVARLLHIQTPRLAGPLQGLAAQLVALVVIGTAAGAARGSMGGHPSAPPGALGAVVAHVTASAGASAGLDAPRGSVVQAATVGRSGEPARDITPARHRTEPWIVRHGQTLWGEAEQRYGSGGRWPSIWKENAGREEPGGRQFTDPNLIVPGWRLDVPVSDDWVGSSADSGDAPKPATQVAPSAGTPSPTQAAPSPATPAGIGSVGPSAPPRYAFAPPAVVVPGSAPPIQGTGIGASAPPSAEPGRRAGSVWSVALPLGGTVGLSLAAVVAAAVARARIHERRTRRLPEKGCRVDTLLTPTVQALQHAAVIAGSATRRQSGDAGCGPVVLETLLEDVPGRMPVGVTEEAGQVVGEARVDFVRLAGVAMVGPGAEAAVRALVAGMVGHHAEEQARVLVAGDARSLLAGIETVPGVVVEPDVARALVTLEDAFVRGGRELVERGVGDCAETAASDSPMETLLVVLTAAEAPAPGSLLPWDIAARRGVAAVCVGDADGFMRLHIDADGVLDAEGRRRLGGTERLHLLGSEEAADIFAALAASREAPLSAPEATIVEELAPTEAVPAGDARASVDVRLFGRPRVCVNGAEVETGLRARGLGVLALLSVRPGGMSSDELLDKLWHVEGEEAGRHDLNVVNSSVRRRLSQMVGRELRVVTYSGERYRIDPTEVDVDVWRFDRALAAARASVADPAGRHAALERAAAEVTGEPLEGVGAPWADEGLRERLRLRMLNVLVEVADLRDAAGDPEGAISILEQALRVDPCAEDVCRRLMVLEARCGRPDAAQRAYRQLCRELHREVGVSQPEVETETLMEALREPVREVFGRDAAAGANAGLRVLDDTVARA